LRAGVAAFSLSLGLAVLAGQALHPQPASKHIPSRKTLPKIPFSEPSASALTFEPQSATQTAPNPLPKLPSVAPAATQQVLSASSKTPHVKREDAIADDDVEVIVRKPAVSHPRPAKKTTTIAHYSDLD
jgi:hypothetical protein